MSFLWLCPVYLTTGNDREPEPGPSSAVDAPALQQQKEPQQTSHAGMSAVSLPPERKANSDTGPSKKKKKRWSSTDDVSASGPDTTNSKLSELAQVLAVSQFRKFSVDG